MNKQVIIYQTADGKAHIDVKVEGETVWISLIQMAELFERDKSVISRHLNNIYKEGELEKNPTVAKFATVQWEGSRQINSFTLLAKRKQRIYSTLSSKIIPLVMAIKGLERFCFCFISKSKESPSIL
jgi:hypothetical protein